MTNEASTRLAPRASHLTGSRNARRPGASQDQVQITYVSHLTENGVDRRFIQVQVGHECDSSTAIYTHVSDDFMNTMLKKALSPVFDPPAPLDKEP
jgi:site-specific recombinase XerC